MIARRRTSRTRTSVVDWRCAAGAVALLASCADGPPPSERERASSPADTAAAAAADAPGITFDPAAFRPGDVIGVLVLDSIDARPNIVDSTHVGTAWFGGEIELQGRTMPHFDADLRASAVCFEADAASAARLPRWLHDERRPWFCFANAAAAAAALGPPGVEVEAAVVVDRFTIHRGLSDQVNSARLVRRVDDGGAR
jgi:hypothetical protein